MTKRFEELLAAAKSLDLEVLARKVKGFSVPQQERARDKTLKILAATGVLLEDRTLSSISIAEIAQMANCSVATLYSRFAEKESLIPASYLLIRRLYVSRTKFDLPSGEAHLDEICLSITTFIREWFISNKFLERTMLESYCDEIGDIVAGMNDRFCRYINPTIANILNTEPTKTLENVRLAIDLNMTLHRDANIYTTSGSAPYPDPARVVRLMTLIIKASQTDDRVIL